MAHNARVPIIDPADAKGEVASFYDACTTFRGRVANSARVWGNIPYLAKFHLLAAITPQRQGGGGVLTCRIKEMTVLKTSHVNGCAY